MTDFPRLVCAGSGKFLRCFRQRHDDKIGAHALGGDTPTDPGNVKRSPTIAQANVDA